MELWKEILQPVSASAPLPAIPKPPVIAGWVVNRNRSTDDRFNVSVDVELDVGGPVVVAQVKNSVRAEHAEVQQFDARYGTSISVRHRIYTAR